MRRTWAPTLRFLPPFWNVCLALYGLTLAAATHWPAGATPEAGAALLEKVGDKWLHMAAFAGLAVLAAGVWTGLRGLKPRSAFILLTIISLYAAVDESTQGLVPGRNPDVLDWAADTIGAAAGLSVYWGASLGFRVSGFGFWGRMR